MSLFREKEIKLRMTEEIAQAVISALQHEINTTGNENEYTADLREIIFRIKWEFNIDNIESDFSHNLELLEYDGERF